MNSMDIKIIQSTKPHWLRQFTDASNVGVTLFQSTKPQRLRHTVTWKKSIKWTDFNPRSRIGSDVGQEEVPQEQGISIHEAA